MNRRISLVGAVIVAASVAALSGALVIEWARPSRATACAVVFREDRPVRVSGEEAAIVWDPASRTQHFIRTAAFEGASADFGFLVPTPARPELAEVDDGVFARLFTIYRSRPRSADGLGRSGGMRAAAVAAPQSVQVLERRTVAGLDAAVLAANDANALNRWLSEHGYSSGPELAQWLRSYVARQWIVTAFRIDPGAQQTLFGTRAVRMSFRTDAPFFPYSEPRARGRVVGRPFRVSVVAPSRMRVRGRTRGWRGRVGFAAQPGLSLVGAMAGTIPPGAVPDASWLTVFDEPSSVRGADDLFFEADTAHPGPVESTITTMIGQGARRPTAR